MIVKILLPNDPTKTAVLFSKDRKLVMRIAPTSPLHAKMRGREKAYFHADSEHGSIEITDEATGQDW